MNKTTNNTRPLAIIFFIFAAFLVTMMDDVLAKTDKDYKNLTECSRIQSCKSFDLSNEAKEFIDKGMQ